MNLAVLVGTVVLAGLLALACPAGSARAAPEPLPLTPELRAQVDALVARASGGEPGGAPAVAVALVAGGKLAYERAAGFADLAARIPATTQTRFRVGSITKMFTAVSVLQLAERHALALDDTLVRYLPWAPHAAAITLRQLLMHTSGLPNYLDEAFAADSVATAATPRALIETVAQRPLEFPPGTRYAYSNTGYVLLGLVVEAVAGEPLADYERTHVFGPARMRDTSVGAPPPEAPLALGYQDESGAAAQRFDPSWLYADGDAVSTAGDLARFDIALMNGVLLGPQALAQMQAESVATGEGDERYGLGLSLAPFGPLTLAGHHGGLPGFESDDELLLAKRSAIVVLSNAFTFRTSYLVSDLLAALFPAAFAATIAGVKAEIVEIAPGEDFAVTALLRRFLDGLRSGCSDGSELTAPLAAALQAPGSASAAARLAPLGELQSLVFRGRSERGDFSEYHYVGVFAAQRLPLTFVLDRNGKIAGLWIR